MARLDFALLCHSALAADGMLSILGAGINAVVAPAPLPAPLVVTVAFQVAWEEDELRQGQTLDFRVIDPSGHSIAEIRSMTVPMRPPAAHPGPIRTNGVTPMAVVVQDYGEHFVELVVSGVTLTSVSLRVLPG